MTDRCRINYETGESVTSYLPTEDGANSSILFLYRHHKSVCIFLNKRWVERSSKAREDKTFTNEVMKVSIVIKK